MVLLGVPYRRCTSSTVTQRSVFAASRIACISCSRTSLIALVAPAVGASSVSTDNRRSKSRTTSRSGALARKRGVSTAIEFPLACACCHVEAACMWRRAEVVFVRRMRSTSRPPPQETESRKFFRLFFPPVASAERLLQACGACSLSSKHSRHSHWSPRNASRRGDAFSVQCFR